MIMIYSCMDLIKLACLLIHDFTNLVEHKETAVKEAKNVGP